MSTAAPDALYQFYFRHLSTFIGCLRQVPVTAMISQTCSGPCSGMPRVGTCTGAGRCPAGRRGTASPASLLSATCSRPPVFLRGSALSPPRPYIGTQFCEHAARRSVSASVMSGDPSMPGSACCCSTLPYYHATLDRLLPASLLPAPTAHHMHLFIVDARLADWTDSAVALHLHPPAHVHRYRCANVRGNGPDNVCPWAWRSALGACRSIADAQGHDHGMGSLL
jgi:hypothetical protein